MQAPLPFDVGVLPCIMGLVYPFAATLVVLAILPATSFHASGFPRMSSRLRFAHLLELGFFACIVSDAPFIHATMAVGTEQT